MKTLETIALEYVGIDPESFVSLDDERIKDAAHFVEGAKSKWVQAEKIKAQLDILNSFYYGEDLNDEDIMRFYTELHTELTEELQQQLKDLEDGLDGHNKE